MKKKLLFVFGTRPEAIKMAPIILAAQKDTAFEVVVCTTGQHREMLAQIIQFFNIKADYAIDLMQPNQTLFDITAHALIKLKAVIEQVAPDCVLVQGDTTTAYVGALAAYYLKIKVAHVEAGLRSFDKYAPFPEEVNRKMIGTIADIHFAPTKAAQENLLKENTAGTVVVTGNTVIDSLLLTAAKTAKDTFYENYFSFLEGNKKIVLITCHRRENFGAPLEHICEAILHLSKQYPQVQFVYPLHLNPNVQVPVKERLGSSDNIFLIAPLDYPHLIWMMNRSYFIITDSGGIQEEAPALGKPVVVLRDVTERMEGVIAGNAVLTGASKEKIVHIATALLEEENTYSSMSQALNPYGDGTSAQQIVTHLKSMV